MRADHELFLALYKYRALSTSQVRKIMDYGDKYVYKKLNKLRKEGYIISQHIRGNYILGQSRQGKYHRLSQKGLNYLKENGLETYLKADDLRARELRLPYLLTRLRTTWLDI